MPWSKSSEGDIQPEMELQTRKVNKKVGLALDDGEFKWLLDQRLSANLLEIYNLHKDKVTEEMDTDTTVESKDVEMKVAQVVKDGWYEGGWDKTTHKRSGQGRLQYPNGAFYHGNFEKNHPNGIGLKIFPGGDAYFGDFVNGQMEGHGEYFSSEGVTYKGEFYRNVQEGDGTQTWPDGTKYTGSWKEGKKHGRGKVTVSDGSSYKGAWKEDMMHGEGREMFGIRIVIILL